MLPRLTIKTTFPPVTLRGVARQAIREFGHQHKQKIDAGLLEEMVAKQAVEFCLVHATSAWFDKHPAHNFMALELAADRGTSPAIDQLELVVLPIMKGKTAPRYEVTTLEAHPLDDNYHVARVIHEASTLKP